MTKYLKDHWVSIAIITLVGILSIGSFFLDLNAFKDYIASAGIWAPILYILAKTSTVVFAPLSGTALYVFSVPLFGFWHGILYSFIGDLIGAIITFYISRFFGRPIVSYFAGKKNMEYIENTLVLMATPKGFISMRLAALSMPEIASYAAGLTSINFTFFIIVHMAVSVVPILTISSLGLFFIEEIPAWMITLGIITAVGVTIGSLAIFAFMLRHVSKKNAVKPSVESSEPETLS